MSTSNSISMLEANEFAKSEGMAAPKQQPELPDIIERFRRELEHYEELVNQTHHRLLMIKKYDEPESNSEAKEKTPESALEELQYLLVRLYRLNDKARINLNHLKEIV